jgi:PAS domain S-box-containing protein
MRLHSSSQNEIISPDSKLASDELRELLLESEANFNETFDQMAIGIAHVALDMRWRRVNQKLCDIVDIPRDELLKRTFEEIATASGLDLNSVRRIMAGETHIVSTEHRIRNLLWINLTVSLVRDAAKAPKYFIIFIEDISARKHAEDALKTLNQKTLELARRNEELEEFVYVVSHDLRAPLVNLQGFSGELETGCKRLEAMLQSAEVPEALKRALLEVANEDIRGAIKFIKASTVRFERLIDALLTLSRTGRHGYKSELIDIQAGVRDILDATRVQIDKAGAQVTVGKLPPAYGDSTAISQVFSNLLVNALKYLKPGRPGRIEVGGERDNGMNHYWVSDNGSGIPESSRAKLFQVFQRFHPKLASGEGMGLAIVKRIIEGHGGKIRATGDEATGTTFHFTLSATENK